MKMYKIANIVSFDFCIPVQTLIVVYSQMFWADTKTAEVTPWQNFNHNMSRIHFNYKNVELVNVSKVDYHFINTFTLRVLLSSRPILNIRILLLHFYFLQFYDIHYLISSSLFWSSIPGINFTIFCN